MTSLGNLACAAAIGIALMQACGGSANDDDGSRGGSGGRASVSGGTAGSGDTPFGGKASGGANQGGAPGAAGDAGSSGDAGSGGEPTKAGAGGGPNFVLDAKREILDTALNMDLGNHNGQATITFAPADSPGATVEIGGLSIRSASVDGRPVAFRIRPSRLDLDLPASSEPLAVMFDYSFPVSTTSGVTPNYTMLWPTYCGEVFPCHSEPSDGTTFSLELTNVPNGTQAIYSPLIAAQAPSYMAAWAIGDYRKVELGATTAGTKVAVWHLPGGEADATTGSAHLVQAFDWFEQHLGPYQFGTEVGSVAVNWASGSSGGMEHHPRWHISVLSMGQELTHAHEASHGWFGNGVRLRCWEDFVLSEGTASYLAARVLEEVGATAASEAAWKKHESDLEARRAGTGNGIAWPQTCGAINVVQSGLYSRITYVKGALFLRALEQRVGRPLFDAALRTFYDRFAGQAAGVQDLLDVVAEVSAYDPSACADVWLKRLPIPTVGACP